VNTETWNWKKSMADLRPPEEVAAVNASARDFIGYTYFLLAILLAPSMLTAQTNVITTVAGRGGALVSLSLPRGVAVDAAGNCYPVDAGSWIIWKISKGTASAFEGTQGSDEPDGLSK